MIEISDDISTLTTIPKTAIDDLFDTEALTISHCVYESACSGQECTKVDIGIGILSISIVDDEIKLKLDPGKKFSEFLLLAAGDGIDPLTIKIDESLKDRVNKIYKELM